MSRSPRLGRLIIRMLLRSEVATALEGDLEEGYRRRVEGAVGGGAEPGDPVAPRRRPWVRRLRAWVWFWWQVAAVPYWSLGRRARRLERRRKSDDPAGRRSRRREDRTMGSKGGSAHDRESGGWSVGGWGMDVRIALRKLVRRPAFGLTAILTLTLSVGAATLLFSVTEGILLRPLPLDDPGRVVSVYLLNHEWRASENRLLRVSWDSYPVQPDHVSAFREGAPELSRVASYTIARGPLLYREREEDVRSVDVGRELFATLGVLPVMGRLPAPEEYAEGTPVAVLRHDLWQDVFGGDPNVIGGSFRFADEVHTVIGVMPPGFYFPEESGGRLWRPIPTDQVSYLRFGVARLAPEISVEDASEAVDRIARRLGEENPEVSHFGARVTPMLEDMVEPVRAGILVLFAGGLVVVLVACVNLANLVLVRGAGRRGELAVRAAIGASRASLTRAVFSEVGIVCLVGGGLGLLAAAVLVDPFVEALVTSLQSLPRARGIGLNPTVVAFTVAVTLGTTLLAGLPGALTASSRAPANALAEAAGRGVGGSQDGGRRVLLGVQVGLAALLISGAGLLSLSAFRAGSVDPGFTADGLAWVQLAMPVREGTEGAGSAGRDARMEELRAELKRLEGVRSVAFAKNRPIGSGMMTLNNLSDPADPGGADAQVSYDRVDSPYFSTFGIPLVRGRLPEVRRAEGEPVPAVVTERLAHSLAPEGSVVGKRLRFGTGEGARPVEVVAVAADTRHFILMEPQGQIYLVDGGTHTRIVHIFLRTSDEASTLSGPVRSVVGGVFPGAEIEAQGTLRADLSDATLHLRVRAGLMSALAGLASILAVVGIAGVAAHFLAAQYREVAVRMAMGAEPGREMRRVLAHALVPATLGLVLGLGATRALAGVVDRIMSTSNSNILFETSATEPLLYAAVAGLLLLASLVAAWLPSRRVTAVDPARVLNAEG